MILNDGIKAEKYAATQLLRRSDRSKSYLIV